MGSGTSISWTDATWNPIRGCRRTAPNGSKQSGCGDPTGGGCYAERQAARFSGPGGAYEGLIKLTKDGPRWSGKTKFVTEHLADPLRWKAPRRIFVDSMSDLFYEGFTNEQIAAVFGVMAAAHQHTFQVLTKRARRMREWFEWVGSNGRASQSDTYGWINARARDALPEHQRQLVFKIGPACWPLPNVWLGVSVENQAAADERIPDLLATPAAVRFLSCEPLLGPIDLRVHMRGFRVSDSAPLAPHWVIAGCESGPKSRECQVEWLREIRDYCAASGVAFFLKQAEESADCGRDRELDIGDDDTIAFGDGSRLKGRVTKGNHVIEQPYLDGVQHAAFPEVRP